MGLRRRSVATNLPRGSARSGGSNQRRSSPTIPHGLVHLRRGTGGDRKREQQPRTPTTTSSSRGDWRTQRRTSKSPAPRTTAIPAKTSHSSRGSTGSYQPLEQWLVANTPAPTTTSATTAGEGLCRSSTGDVGLCGDCSTIQRAVETKICPGLRPLHGPMARR